MRRDERDVRTVGPCVLTSLHSCLAKLAKMPLIAAPRDSAPRGHECSTQMRDVVEGGSPIRQERRSVNQQLDKISVGKADFQTYLYAACRTRRST